MHNVRFLESFYLGFLLSLRSVVSIAAFALHALTLYEDVLCGFLRVLTLLLLPLHSVICMVALALHALELYEGFLYS